MASKEALPAGHHYSHHHYHYGEDGRRYECTDRRCRLRHNHRYYSYHNQEGPGVYADAPAPASAGASAGSHSKKAPAVTPAHAPPGCEVCSKPASHACASCKSAYYCGAAHQAADWGSHAELCGQRPRARQQQQTSPPADSYDAGYYYTDKYGHRRYRKHHH